MGVSALFMHRTYCSDYSDASISLSVRGNGGVSNRWGRRGDSAGGHPAHVMRYFAAVCMVCSRAHDDLPMQWSVASPLRQVIDSGDPWGKHPQRTGGSSASATNP